MTENKAFDLVKKIYAAVDEKKGENIKVIDIAEISVLCDYFLICHGFSQPQVEAIKDNVEDRLLAEGYKPQRVEGHKNSGWILIDYGDVVVHIFTHEQRMFYDLERIWKDGIVIDM